MKTKILIPFLVLAVLPPMLAKAQVNYAVSGNTAYVTNSPNASGNIVIASTYEGHPVTSIGVAAFSGRTNLTSVTIPNSVTSIGQGAFFHCSHLTSVLIPNSVTGIGGSAFQNCTSLTSVTIPNSVTSIGIQAFLGTSLTNITVDATNPDYSSLNGVLFDKTQTTLITFPGGLVGSYVIPNSVTNIGYFAFSVTSLTNVSIPNSVTSIGEEAFSGCIPLTSVTIPNSVTNIGYFAFEGCFSLASIVIPDSVTSIAVEAFYNCISLTSVTIPNSVISIGDSAFQNCNKLMSVMIGNSVTNIGEEAFLDCTSLTNIIVDAANPAYSSLNGVLFDKTQTTLITFPDGLDGSYVTPNSVTSIGDFAFQDCTSLTNVTIPNRVTRIGDFVFEECLSLSSVMIGNSVTNIGDGSFDDCPILTNLTFLGNAPGLGNSVFGTTPTKVYYYAGMKGWGAKYGGLSTVKLGEPTLSIVAPKTNERWSNSVFTVTGTVQNNAGLAGVGLAGVFYSLNNGAWTSVATANGWSNWMATVTLTPGTNTIAAYAEDTEGITSTTNTVKFIYVLTVPLTVNLNGDGTVSPNYNNELLEIGTSYSMTAKAATGFGFTGWTGSVTTNGATLKFVMASNLTFTANFVDTTKPTLSITTPKANAKLTNVVLAVTGTAKDNAELAGVFYSLNNGAWAKAATANGWSNWTAIVTLTQKTNTIAAYAQDAADNFSTTNTVKFTLTVTPPSGPPQIGSGSAGVQTGGKFGFTITGMSSQTVVVEASTNLVDWQPIWTNTLSGVSTNFTDSQWTNFPNRYYRAR